MLQDAPPPLDAKNLLIFSVKTHARLVVSKRRKTRPTCLPCAHNIPKTIIGVENVRIRSAHNVDQKKLQK